MTPRSLINPEEHLGGHRILLRSRRALAGRRSDESAVQLTHERRLSALGPGGLNRKRAGFEVRDVHISHYGRICPIETPEGTNIGLISSLAMYADVDEYGFLITPYRKVTKGKLTEEVVWLRADEESEAFVASADSPIENDKISGDTIVARYRADFVLIPVDQIAIHRRHAEPDDRRFGRVDSVLRARRRQPRADGFQHAAASGAAVGYRAADRRHRAWRASRAALRHDRSRRPQGHGHVRRCRRESRSVREVHPLRKFVGLNERTCQNQKPIVSVGDKVEKGQVIADGAATYQGELALGRNVLVAFMSCEGYNFEDAIIISEELVKNDTYTSIHIEEFDVEIRETKLGREEFTRDIPNVSEKMLRNLDENGIVQIGTFVEPGDILVGKVSPKSKTELTPEEKLLHAIFGRAGEDVKNDSLEVPSGVEGIVIDTQRFSRRMSLSEDQRKEFERSLKAAEKEGNEADCRRYSARLIGEVEEDARPQSDG